MKNDRFRFRFWDNHDKKYYFDTREFELSDLRINDAMGVFEQCTGLRDRNDKLIFEGDIVKCVSGRIGVAVWNDDFARFEAVFSEIGEWPCDICNTQEIIGNIHEVEKD